MADEFSPTSRPRPITDFRTRLAWLIVTSGGLGAIPLMPGTFGTLGGVVIAGLVGAFAPIAWSMPILGGCLLAVSAINVLLGGWCERFFRGKDPQSVVIDEVAGYLLATVITWPLVTVGHLPLTYELAAVFLLFRVFDIVKPFPAQHAEKLPQGWGVLADDLVAGVFAGGSLWLVAWLLPWWKAFTM